MTLDSARPTTAGPTGAGPAGRATREPAWVDRYVGIPFKVGGRDFTGVDCYGLYWLIRKEEYGETLPLFLEDFTPEDVAYIRDLIAGHMGAWRKLEAPEVGSAVLLTVQRVPSHIGVMIGRRQFIHVTDTANQVCKDPEGIGGVAWPERKVWGYYQWAGGAA